MMKQRVSITLQDYRGSIIRLSIGLLEVLDYPRYVRLLMNQETLELGIQPTNKDDIKGLKVLYTKTSSTSGANICSKITISKIYEMLSLEENHTYRVKQYKISDGIAIFSLSSAYDVSKMNMRKANDQ